MNERNIHNFSQDREIETSHKQITTPDLYLDNFLHSPEFKQGLAGYKKIREKENLLIIDNDELIELFLETDKFKDSFCNYYMKNELIYDENLFKDNKYSDFTTKLEKYWQSIRSIRSKEKMQFDRDELIEEDRKRSIFHTACANELVKIGDVPNPIVGRKIVHFYSISVGLDSIDRGMDDARLNAYR